MYSRKPLSALIVATILSSGAPTVQAGFIDQRSTVHAPDVSSEPPPVTTPPAAPALPVKAGAAPMDPVFVASLPLVLPVDGVWAQPARGFGRDEPVFDALRALLPGGYTLSYDVKLAPKPVSWRGGAPRTEVIQKVLMQAGYRGHLEGMELVVEPGQVLASSAPMVLPAADPQRPSALNASLTPVPPGTDPAGQWSASESDVNLRLALKHWTERANWQLVWDYGEDVPLNAGDTTNGSFKDAVRHLLSSTEMSDTPLKPCFYSNSVVRVVAATVKCDPNE